MTIDNSSRQRPRRRRGSSGCEDVRRHEQEKPSLRSRIRLPVEEDDDSDAVVARTDVPDLREKLRRRTQSKGEFSPLRIEIDNEEYYGIVGSESE